MIGLITFHRLPNFGACLQAWALVQVVRDMGQRIQVIDYRSKVHERKFRRKGFRRLVPSIGRIRLHRFVESKLPLTEPCRSHSELVAHVARHDYTALLCGSDQIWLADDSHGLDPAYFLDAGDNGHPSRIAYAPSAGGITSFGSHAARIGHLLKQFDAVSVRDTQTRDLVNSLGVKGARLVADPTLIGNLEPLRGRPSSIEPYLAIVGPMNLAGSTVVARIAKQLGLRSIAFGTRCATADHEHRFVAPDEWLTGIASAQFVVSSLFHGVALSLAFQKPFLALDNAGRGPKILDLLGRVNLSSQLLRVSHGVYDVADEQIYMNPDIAATPLQEMVADSQHFLQSALEAVSASSRAQ